MNPIFWAMFWRWWGGGMIPFGTHIAAALVAEPGLWRGVAGAGGNALRRTDRHDQAAAHRRGAVVRTQRAGNSQNTTGRMLMLSKAEARAAQNKRDADRLRDELDWLRGDLANVPGRIRSATREAVDQYAATATTVFGARMRRDIQLELAAAWAAKATPAMSNHDGCVVHAK